MNDPCRWLSACAHPDVVCQMAPTLAENWVAGNTTTNQNDLEILLLAVAPAERRRQSTSGTNGP